MRNDARPIGHDVSDRSPVAGHPPPEDSRDSVAQDRQSHVVNRPMDEEVRRKDADIDPTMPTSDSTLRTEI
jgi:hypothetical protein